MSTQPPTQSFLREGGARALLRLIIYMCAKARNILFTLNEKVCEVTSLVVF